MAESDQPAEGAGGVPAGAGVRRPLLQETHGDIQPSSEPKGLLRGRRRVAAIGRGFELTGQQRVVLPRHQRGDEPVDTAGNLSRQECIKGPWPGTRHIRLDGLVVSRPHLMAAEEIQGDRTRPGFEAGGVLELMASFPDAA